MTIGRLPLRISSIRTLNASWSVASVLLFVPGWPTL